jgi:hypothetical protein
MFHLLTCQDPIDNGPLLFDFSRNPRPLELNPELSAEMDAILARMLAPKPVERYPSVGALRTALYEHARMLG